MSYEKGTRGSTRRTSNYPRPVVETGKEYTVEITDNGRAGDGIARIEGFVIFVKSSKAGSKDVKTKIDSVKEVCYCRNCEFNKFALGFRLLILTTVII